MLGGPQCIWSFRSHSLRVGRVCKDLVLPKPHHSTGMIPAREPERAPSEEGTAPNDIHCELFSHESVLQL